MNQEQYLKKLKRVMDPDDFKKLPSLEELRSLSIDDLINGDESVAAIDWSVIRSRAVDGHQCDSCKHVYISKDGLRCHQMDGCNPTEALKFVNETVYKWQSEVEDKDHGDQVG